MSRGLGCPLARSRSSVATVRHSRDGGLPGLEIRPRPCHGGGRARADERRARRGTGSRRDDRGDLDNTRASVVQLDWRGWIVLANDSAFALLRLNHGLSDETGLLRAANAE